MRTSVILSALLIALIALSLCGPVEARPPQRRVRELIEQVETGPTSQVLTAIKELTKFKARAKKAAAPIARHLSSTDAELRAASVAALRAIGKAAAKPVVGVFQEQVEGRGAEGLGASWDLLQDIDEKRARETCLDAVGRAKLAEAGALALSGLGEFGVECLFRAAHNDQNVAAAFLGVQSATELAPWTAEATEPLAEGLADDDTRIALTAAATHEVRADHLKRYEQWTAGQPASLRLAGIWALGELGATALEGSSADPLLALLDDEDKLVRRSALWAITRIAAIGWQPRLIDLIEAEAYVPREYPDGPMVRLGAPPIEMLRLTISHLVKRPYLDDDAAVVGLMLSMKGLAAEDLFGLSELRLPDLTGKGPPKDERAVEAGLREVWDLGSRWHRSIPSLPPRIHIESIDPTAAQEALAQRALAWANARDGVVADGMLMVAASLCPKGPDIFEALVAASNEESPYRKRIGFAGVATRVSSSTMTVEEHRRALTEMRSPTLAELLVFAGQSSGLEALMMEASDPDLAIYPWTWIDVLELEGPTERMQAILRARLKGGDLSMAALVTEFCTDPRSALLPLLQSESALTRMVGVGCFRQLGDKANMALLRNTAAASPAERDFIKRAVAALK